MTHRIVIVGGGAGGLELAVRLGRKLARRGTADVTLVDAALTHIWKPLLHQVAAGTLNSYQDELAYAGVAADAGFRFAFGRMERLEPERGEIRLAPVPDEHGREILPARTFGYDSLVLAIGSETADFGVPGADRWGWKLDDREQADRLHRHLLGLVVRRALVERDRNVRISVVGAGATGIELVAEIHHAVESARSYGIDLPQGALRIALIERAPRILGQASPEMAAAITRRLTEIGVEVMTGRGVEAVAEDAVTLDGGDLLRHDLCVWAAGVRGRPVLRECAILPRDRAGRIRVTADLRVEEQPESWRGCIYAMGDCAATPQPDGGIVPPTAQAAHQQANYLARALRDRLDRAPVTPFVYRDHGTLVSLARYGAHGILRRTGNGRSVRIDGLLAELAYRSLYRSHQSAVLGPFRSFLLTIADTLRRSTHPRLKLH